MLKQASAVELRSSRRPHATSRFAVAAFLGLLPRMCFHFVRRPYRVDVPEIDYRSPHPRSLAQRASQALYDTMYDALLDAYRALTGMSLEQNTGRMLVFLVELTRRADEHVDGIASSATEVTAHDILELPQVREQIGVLRRYLESAGRAEPIVAYLHEMFITHYSAYAQVLKSASMRGQFDDILETIEVDSGMAMHSWMHVVALFNGHELPSAALDQFFSLGMVGKFADDWIDVGRDVEKAQINLLYSLASRVPSELATLSTAIVQKKNLGARSLARYCPNTFKTYLGYIEQYRRTITCKQVDRICDLFLLPAVLGIDYEALGTLQSNGVK